MHKFLRLLSLLVFNMWNKKLHVLLILSYIYHIVSALNDPIVSIKHGKLRGRKIQTHAGRTIYSFTGIPYAKPPVSELRFKSPVTPDPWEGIKNVKNEAKMCFQNDFLRNISNLIIGEEDCLYLNVYTTKIRNETETDPVLVYIHGGGWLYGKGSDYGPEYLLEHDVVLVTFNYRLGPLGFLSTEDEISPGNYGLKDQLQVLHWVKENIISFRGDPDRVTIAGQSAGGASVHYHIVSPLSKGLFHGAISFSGNAFAPWASARQPAFYAQRLAKLLNCTESPSSALVECLNGKSASEIAQGSFDIYEWKVDPLILFPPVIEPKHSGQNFLPAPVIDLMRETEKDIDNVPWILGITSEDGSFNTANIFSKPTIMDDFSGKFDEIAPNTFTYKETGTNIAQVTDKIKKFYYNNAPITVDKRTETTNLFTDRYFIMGIDKAMEILKEFNSQRLVYLYNFSHRGLHSFTTHIDKSLPKIDYGVCHGDDLQYIFYMPSYYPAVPVDKNSSDHQMMTLMTQIIADFVRTGQPTPEEEKLNTNGTFIWTVANNEKEFAEIKLPKPQMLDGILHSERRKFWKELNLNEHVLRQRIKVDLDEL